MENIQSIFREVQQSFSDTEPVGELIARLNVYEPEFRSVAFEAAAMCVALNYFLKGNSLLSWKEFLKLSGGKHNTQIHIGMGWALAQQAAEPTAYLKECPPMMRYRLMDGYGYYEGIFRKRKTIISRQAPDWNDETAKSAYDQGLGRSIWYLNGGKPKEVQQMMEGFEERRMRDLWRGLGIALCYVGGVDEHIIYKIKSAAGKYLPQFSAGVLMAAASRVEADSVNQDTKVVATRVCNKTPQELWKESNVIKTNLETDENAYAKWIEALEVLFV